ncbi:MAG: efflux RND transporter permease subunit, partial [Deltaproteobacteria bacterium]
MKLTDVCIARPTLAWMLMAATVVFGGLAATRMGISQFPDVDFPVISVSLSWPGASAEVMEHDVVGPIEEAMTQVEGVTHLYATASQGSGWVGVELDLSRSVDVALQDVQSRVARAMRALPANMDPPTVSKSNPEDQPIIWVGLSGTVAPQQLADLARDQIRNSLQTIDGVGEISMGGYLDRNIRIWIDADRLRERGLTVLDVHSALQREHVERPAGRLENPLGETNIRVLGEFRSLEALQRLVLQQQGNTVIRLQDVALIEDGFEDVRRLARVRGQPAQGLGVRKQRGANAVAVARAVRQAIDT